MSSDKGATVRVSRRDVEAGRLPLRARLKAWWDGYDIEMPRPRGKGGKKRSGHQITAPKQKLPWDDPRISLVQAVWGHGFDRPGSEDFVVELLNPVGLDPSMSGAVLDAGVGGAARAVSRAFDVWITGFECEEKLVDAGNKLSKIAGLTKKAPIHPCDASEPPLKTRGYDCVFGHESFFQVPEKALLLETVEKGLKPGGQLLFTDYVLADSRATSPALEEMLENESKKPHVWSVFDYRTAMSDLELDIRVSEDITERIAGMIRGAWGDFMNRSESWQELGASSETVLEEAELWTRRLRALQEGALRVYRFHALKRNSSKLLSNW
jgi:SAM-dependent methyltransferase